MSVEQLLSLTLHNRNPILEVGVYPAEGKSLTTALGFLEGIVGIKAIVTVVVVDANAVLGSELLKCVLGENTHFGQYHLVD